jgi:hypothetical protein
VDFPEKKKNLQSSSGLKAEGFLSWFCNKKVYRRFLVTKPFLSFFPKFTFFRLARRFKRFSQITTKPQYALCIAD